MRKADHFVTALRWLLPALVLAVTSCRLVDEPLDVTCPPGQFGISDGSHQSGNLHFFFLPPLVPQPAYQGTFDPSLKPRVELWERMQDGTWHPLAVPFTMTTGPGSETLRVDPVAEHYVVNWHTDRFPLDLSNLYRIRVFVGKAELGYADVDVVARSTELKNVQTGEFIPLLNGRTLPVKFRIERGVLGVVGPIGGVISSDDGLARLEVPPGSLDQSVEITVTPVGSCPEEPGTIIVPSTVYEFSPAGLAFAPPALLSIGYTEGAVPEILAESSLRLLHQTADGWEEVSGSTVDTSRGTVHGSIDGFGRYAVGSVANLKGYVRDTDGSPIPGALVRLYRGDWSAMTASDQRGFYAFHGVPEGTYYLVAKRDGFTMSTSIVTVH